MLYDIRYAVRQLFRAPGFTVVALSTLALGIGANTAMFGAIDNILLAPLPYNEADRIVTLWQTDPAEGVERDEVSPANFLDWRARSDSFERIAAAEPFSMDHVGPDGPERFPTWRVTEGFLDVFGVAPMLGRTFLDEEHGPGSARVAVLGYGVWQNRFSGDPDTVGSEISLDGQPTTIVGVMPPEFEFPPGRGIWVPRVPQGWEGFARGSAYWQVVGKLKPGVARGQAQAELDGIAAQLAEEYAASNAGMGIAILPLADYLVGDVRPALLLLWAAVGFVLLIACVNVANLLLARTAGRSRELALRAVLGADRLRVVRQLITECIVLALFGGATGLILGYWGLELIERFQPVDWVEGDALGIDTRVVAFTAFLALGSAILCGLAPAIGAAGTDLRARLQSGVRVLGPAARRLRTSLVVSEIALAMALLIAAGLLIRSFATLQETDRGFVTDNVVALTVQAWNYYPEPERRALFVADTLERIASLPGVRAAGVASSVPLAPDLDADTASFTISGRPIDESLGEPIAHTTVVTNGFFDALGVRLLDGRAFSSTDALGRPGVAIVNETMARRYWPGGDPLGSTIRYEFTDAPIEAEIVGVVSDVRHLPHEPPRPSLFLPHAQVPTGGLAFVVRSAGDIDGTARAVREEISALDATMPIVGPVAMNALLDDAFSARRFGLSLVLAFSLSALALAAVGAYGLLSYESGRRAQEIGVRMALGADGGRVVRLVVASGLKLALIGVAAGAVIAAAVSRVLSTFLYGIGPFDPATFAGVAALLVVITAIASWIPARRAARVDPMISLRAE